MKVRVTYEFTVQRIADDEAERLGQDAGVLEVLDSDNLRYDITDTVDAAIESITELFDGIGIGAFTVEKE